MKIRQLSNIEFISEDLGNKTSLEIYDEKYVIRFRWSIIPKRNKIYIDVLLLEGDWCNVIVLVEKEPNSGFEYFEEYDTTLPQWSEKMKNLYQRINDEIEILKLKKWL
jgi:hypothetical protein